MMTSMFIAHCRECTWSSEPRPTRKQAQNEALKLTKCPKCKNGFTRLTNGTLWGFWIDELQDDTVDTFVNYVDEILKKTSMKDTQYIHCYEDHGYGSGSATEGRYTGLRINFKNETKTIRAGPAVGMHIYDQDTNAPKRTIFFSDDYALLQLATDALKGYQYLRKSKEL